MRRNRIMEVVGTPVHNEVSIFNGATGSINSSVKGLMKDGFGFLENIGNPADSPVAPRKRDTVSDATLFRHLGPLREARVWFSGKVPAQTTNLRFYRVMVTGDKGAVVEFRAGK